MVSFFFPPDYSGSAVQAHNLSRHLQRLGLEPFIVSANLSGSAAYEVYDGVPVYRIPAIARNYELQIASFWVSLSAFLWRRRREFDVVHAHGTVQHAIASVVCRALGKPSILKVSMAQSDLAFGRQGRALGTVNRSFVSRFDRYIALTDGIAIEFRDEGLDTSRVRLIPNGVDTEAYAPVSPSARAALKSSLGLPDVPIVTYVGIINGRKNVDGILRIWADAVKRGAPGHLALIGPMPDGPDAPFIIGLRQFIQEAGLGDRVTFLGQRSPATPFLQASDVFLFPSRQEGMANSVLEAMACGLPCLVSGTAGVTGVVTDGDTGFALNVDDEASFARVLTDLLTQPALGERIGAAARARIEQHFSLAAVARRYASLYHELLERNETDDAA